MNAIVHCPACGFRGLLPASHAALKSIVCPKCHANVSLAEVRQLAENATDDSISISLPIWVDGEPGTNVHAPPPEVRPQAEMPAYTGDYMKDEAARFSQYVAARLSELHKRRHELADAECRFEAMTMERKQELYRQQAAILTMAEETQRRELTLQQQLAALTAREAELTQREARVSRLESRTTDLDRRTAELRATLDQIEARRAALAEERTRLDQRAESLDRAELALQRRSAELDEIDEQLRQEQDEWETQKLKIEN
jgi:hypothetical protein